MKIRKQIQITYNVDIDVDYVEERLDLGVSIEDILEDLNVLGIESNYVFDAEVVDVSDIAEPRLPDSYPWVVY